MKNKKIIIISIVAILIFIIILAIIINKKASSALKKGSVKLPTVELSELFDVDNINKVNKVELQKTKDVKVSNKYVVGTNTYLAKADVKFEERKGKVIFLREQYNNVNIYQAKYGIDEIDSVSRQISDYIEEFKQKCINYMGVTDEDLYSETLYNKNDEDKNISLGESIFNGNKLYSLTYKIKDNDQEYAQEENGQSNDSNEQVYDINFYRDGTYLVCEFVKML